MKKLITVAAFGILLGLGATAQAAGDPAAGQQKSATCAGCHGADGNSVNPEWPKLAGQHVKYVVKQLQNFKDMDRVNNLMNGLAAALSQEDMEDLAAYYESQALAPAQADPGLVELGKQVFRGGNLQTGLSACTGCHGPNGNGNPAAGFPSLAGQHAQYTETQLKSYRTAERANDPGQMMRNVASRMTDEEIKAVASYIQGLQ